MLLQYLQEEETEVLVVLVVLLQEVAVEEEQEVGVMFILWLVQFQGMELLFLQVVEMGVREELELQVNKEELGELVGTVVE